MSYLATFSPTLDGPWRGARCVRIGPPSRDASVYVLAARDEEPLVVVAMTETRSASHVLRDALVWMDNVVIGHGEAVHVVSLSSLVVTSHFLHGYFGHLYATENALLVADASCLRRVSADGNVVWCSQPLGIDVVVVTAIEGDVVTGEGEHDPPGGWRPFRLSLTTGAAVSD